MKIGRWHLILAVLFFLSILISPAIAQVRDSISIVQNQPNWVEQARAFYLAGNYNKAAQMWQKAVNVFAQQNQPLNQAMALSNLSLTYQKIGQWQSAKEAITASFNLLETTVKLENDQDKTQSRLLAQILNIQANLHLETGHPAAALETWVKVTDLYTKIGDKNGVMQSQINQAQAMQELGFYPRACQRLLMALQLEHQTCELSPETLQVLQEKYWNPEEILALRQLGEVLRLIGNLTQSEKVLVRTLEQAQKQSESEVIALVYLSLGQTQRDFGKRSQLSQDFDLALEYYTQAAQFSRSEALKVQARLETLSLFITLQQWSRLPDLITQIQSNINQSSVNYSGIYDRIYFAKNLLKLLQITTNETSSQILENIVSSTQLKSDIEQILIVATQQAQEIGSERGLAYIWGLRGKLYELTQNWSQAEQFTLKSLQMISAYNQPDITYQFFWQLGRIRKAEGRTEEAIDNYTQAVDILQFLRQDLAVMGSEAQLNFRENIEPIYRELIDLILQKPDLQQSDLIQVRDLIESLQINELNNFLKLACLEEEPTQIDKVDPTAAIFYPIILRDRLDVIAAIPGQPLHHYSTSVSQKEVERINIQMRRNLGLLFDQSDILSLTQEIYRWLILPLEKTLEKTQIKTLVFVPDGVLRNVPMALLHDGDRYLLEKYSIATTLPGFKLRDPSALNLEEIKLLVGGLTEARQGFPPLPAVEIEVENISQQFQTSQVFLNDEFTAQNLKDQSTKPTPLVVHLATHGQFSSDREETFILTGSEKIRIDDFEALLEAREAEINPIELLVLSACQTASGDNRATLGLAGLAVRSGARSTLGSLWSVNDQSTAEFMNTFYQKLRQPNINKAEALRLAQLDLLQKGYQKPFYWAPFVLVGNWL